MAFMDRTSQTSTSTSTPATAKSSGAGTSPRMPSSSPKPTTTTPTTVAPLRLGTNSGTDRGNPVPGPMSATSNRAGLGRKPSGARAQATSRTPYNGTGLPVSHQLTEEEETSEDQNMPAPVVAPRHASAANNNGVPLSSPVPSQPKPAFVKNLEAQGDVEEPNEDVLAAISYLNVADGQEGSATGSDGAAPKVEPLKVGTQNRSGLGVGGGEKERPLHSASSVSDSGPGPQFKSSFAPSTSAAKRKAKAQAQQAAHNAAVHKPGRANGKRKSRATGGWNDSTDEEDEEEEEDEDEDDEEVDSDNVPPRMQNARPSVYGQLTGEGPSQPSHLRAPRTLPQPPSSRPGE